TRDLQAQTYQATLRMLLLVAIGLIIVLFAVLRSYILPLLAVATVMLSIGWSWGVTQAVLGKIFGIPLFFFVPTVVIILILGLGIDYNIFVLTRVREERLRGHDSSTAVSHAVASTGGIITAAAIILASAFAILGAGSFLLLRSIGFAVAVAVLLDALVVRTYLVPATLQLLGDRTWQTSPFQRNRRPGAPTSPPTPAGPTPGGSAPGASSPPTAGSPPPIVGGEPWAERACPHCGAGNLRTATFCQKCGTRLEPPS
ncbi:MAG: MMPL family transporter, partial [Thermoplasmata archaeon]|nr:MMPL family transporter [Thermoplasmata archaeon]